MHAYFKISLMHIKKGKQSIYRNNLIVILCMQKSAQPDGNDLTIPMKKNKALKKISLQKSQSSFQKLRWKRWWPQLFYPHITDSFPNFRDNNLSPSVLYSSA